MTAAAAPPTSPRASVQLDLLDASLGVDVEHRFLARTWGRQHVVLAGPASGPPVVLVHGWPEHWFAWRHVIGRLARRGARVVALDIRDLGWSRGDGGRPSIADLASDIVRAIDDLDLPPVVLAAHDWGGWLGFEAVLARPDRFRHYAAMAIVPPWLTWWEMLAHLPGWGYVFPMATIGASIARRPTAVRFLLDHSAEGPVWDRAENQLALASYLDRIATPQAAAMTHHLYRSLVTRALPLACGPRRAVLTVPATMLVGEHETIAVPDLYRRRSEPGELVVLPPVPGVRHWLAEEAPSAVVDHLVEVTF